MKEKPKNRGGRPPMPIEQKRDRVQKLCAMVAEGLTVREIAEDMGFSCGTILGWVAETPEFAEQYARARDAAADIFEADILREVEDIKDAAVSRVRIDALKWVAARRAPKKYGERVQQDHTSSDGSMAPPTRIVIEAAEKGD